MTNPLKQAIQSGIEANAEIGRAFARVGTRENPDGYALTAYREAIRSVGLALRERDPIPHAQRALANLKSSIRAQTEIEFYTMQDFGIQEAHRQMSFYGKGGPRPEKGEFMNLSTESQTALDAVEARIDAQEAVTLALITTGADAEQIVGSEDRLGVLRPGEVTGAIAFWLAALTWDAFSYRVHQAGGLDFQKQAVAAVDHRTTETCLHVHGQIQPLSGKFELVGSPRYADRMDWSPFHAYCRTASVLYLAAYDNGITDQLRASAKTLLLEREAGNTHVIHPANAYYF